MKRHICVVGTGATAMTFAADMGLAGHDVTLFSPDHGLLDTIRNAGGITLTGEGPTGLFLPTLASSIEEALQHEGLVVISSVANRHAELAALCAPWLHSGHIVLLSAGNAGSLLFNRELTARYGQRHGVVLGEMEGNLYPCRRTAPATVIRAWPLSRRRVAAFPACDTPFLIDALQDIMEAIPADNILEAALNAPNVTTHLMASLLNLSSIERYGDDFCLYRDGLTPSVVDMVQRLIEEKARLFNKLGWQQRSSTTLLRKLMAGENAPGLAIFRNLGGPTSATHRYLTEDASTNLSLLWHLGELADTPMPLSAALLTLAGALHGVDYFQQGLKPEDFGWAALSLNDILHLLHEYPSIN